MKTHLLRFLYGTIPLILFGGVFLIANNTDVDLEAIGFGALGFISMYLVGYLIESFLKKKA